MLILWISSEETKIVSNILRKSMNENRGIDKLAIDEAQERLDNFFEILLRADLRTLERLQSKKENDDNKLLDNAC